MNIDEIKKRMSAAVSRRSPWESMWEDCIDYAMPARQSFYSSSAGTERTDRVFDETPIMATAEFASRMQSAIMPPGRKWFKFEVSEVVEEAQRRQLQEDLEQIEDFLYTQILRSNLDAEVHEAFMDLAIGTCALTVNLDPLGRLVFKTASLPTIWIEEGPDGRVGGVYRKRQDQSGQVIKAEYPNARVEEDSKSYTIVEATLRDYSKRMEETYQYTIWIEETNQILVSATYKGWGSNPWISARWAETASEWYGRGPLINILPAIRSVNLIRELIFENSEMAIGGIWQYDNDGTLNPSQIQIAPNTFIPRAPGSRGLEPLQSPARFDIAEANLQDLRQTIKRGLFSEEFTPTGRTPLSAQEIAAKQSDLAQRIGSPFSRILKEMVEPIITRCARLYSDAKYIDIPKIDGQEIKIVSVSPLARAQSAEDIQRYTSYVSTLVNLMGPEAAGSFINTEGTVQLFAELYEFPTRLLLDNDGRVEEAKKGQELQAELEKTLRTMPTQEFQQRVEKGPIQPAL